MSTDGYTGGADADHLADLKEALFEVFKGPDISVPSMEEDAATGEVSEGDEDAAATEEAKQTLRDEICDPLAEKIAEYAVARTGDWFGFAPTSSRVSGQIAESFALQESVNTLTESHNAVITYLEKLHAFLTAVNDLGNFAEAVHSGETYLDEDVPSPVDAAMTNPPTTSS